MAGLFSYGGEENFYAESNHIMTWTVSVPVAKK